VAEIAGDRAPTWVCRVGVRDRFSQYCGNYGYLLREHGLDAAAVIARVEDFLRERIAGRGTFPARAA
jgi:transketolase